MSEEIKHDLSHLKIGFFKGTIQQLNPSKDWIIENYDDSIEEEPEYYFSRRNGNNVAILDFYISNIKDDIFKYSIWLENEEISFNSGAKLWVSQTGDIQITKDEDMLFSNIKAYEDIKWNNGKIESKEKIADKQYKVAIKGEDSLIGLLKNFINIKNPEESVLLNLDKIFEGNIKNIEDLIFNEADFHAVFLATVSSDLKQKIWKEVLPVKLMAEINNNFQISKFSKKIMDKYIENLSYCKDYYILEKMRDFKQSDIPEQKEINDSDDDY